MEMPLPPSARTQPCWQSLHTFEAVLHGVLPWPADRSVEWAGIEVSPVPGHTAWGNGSSPSSGFSASPEPRSKPSFASTTPYRCICGITDSSSWAAARSIESRTYTFTCKEANSAAWSEGTSTVDPDTAGLGLRPFACPGLLTLPVLKCCRACLCSNRAHELEHMYSSADYLQSTVCPPQGRSAPESSTKTSAALPLSCWQAGAADPFNSRDSAGCTKWAVVLRGRDGQGRSARLRA